ncbi:Set6p KNAG_0J01800 [Huiozyma naganishii CBS 8797]|uniref:SET domain-containing protein n=1 Tax=Huiozyma naganishii (strain ATCC MYA-139 / BCRC 22969 / CBS 8797 / KCTC 17520 / NBRC 10181 / NCYC 3082 / Yp74L-3) TaxID=1071383 RepID=J7SAK8_HUIN7|nr:hypothetical protein KNAG_0J01800 [Kazachstania naganishii CBS 8797]CCK72261.1 hypothetical protein KNAG_0J01800 [Kazachstania naganishii CBS 8797]
MNNISHYSSTLAILAANVDRPYNVRQTTWGGRACFATKQLRKGDVVLRSTDFTGKSIAYDFRKEVCHYCYGYTSGRNMKYRISADQFGRLMADTANILKKSNKFMGAGLWFCSDHCLETYLEMPNISYLIDGYEILLNHYRIASKELSIDNEIELNSRKISLDVIEEGWSQVKDSWIPKVEKMKKSKQLNMFPSISEDDYSCARFVTMTLFKLKQHSLDFDTKVEFNGLQSNELDKIKKYPVLLHLQTSVFKILYILLPDILKTHFSIELFRHIAGSEYANAFGLWQEDEGVDSREFLGYSVFPCASYANHSCVPNITKSRHGREMIFTANKDISEGAEICIDCSGVLSLAVEKRRKFLKETWFFDCCCGRCLLEMKTIH